MQGESRDLLKSTPQYSGAGRLTEYSLAGPLSSLCLEGLGCEDAWPARQVGLSQDLPHGITGLPGNSRERGPAAIAREEAGRCQRAGVGPS